MQLLFDILLLLNVLIYIVQIEIVIVLATFQVIPSKAAIVKCCIPIQLIFLYVLLTGKRIDWFDP